MNNTRKLARELQSKVAQGIDEEQIYFLLRYHLRDAVNEAVKITASGIGEQQSLQMKELKQKYGIPK